LKRGDIITANLAGDYGKPRPAVVIQSDRIQALNSVLVCPLTSYLADAEPIRVTIEPSPENGLRARSHIMVDKTTAVSRGRCRDVIGHLDDAVMRELNERLALVIGLAD
jgi:mRNA interferase MazF